jgi:hypothetical protein
MPTQQSLRAVAALGLSSVAIYLAATAVGGVITPGYSHVADPISGLTASHAPHSVVLGLAYVAYNIAGALFGWALARVRTSSRLLRVNAWLMTAGAIAGTGQVTFFRQDTIGAPATTQGMVHIGLAATSALLTVACTIIYAVAFRRDLGWRRLSTFSLACTATILVTGPLAGFSVGTPWMGAVERLPIGTFLLWIAVVSIAASRHARQVKVPPVTAEPGSADSELSAPSVAPLPR